jgi:hypothetical protein
MLRIDEYILFGLSLSILTDSSANVVYPIEYSQANTFLGFRLRLQLLNSNRDLDVLSW